MSRLTRLLTPGVVQTGLAVLLLVAAVFLADAEGGRQIAEDARVQRAAEGVMSAATVTESATQRAVLIARAWEEGISGRDDVISADSALRFRLDELADRVDSLSALIENPAPIREAHARFNRHAEAISAELMSGDVSAAASDDIDGITIASRDFIDIGERVRSTRQAQIDATLEGVEAVANAARLVAGLAIPALILFFLYRYLSRRQRQMLLRAELEREKELRKKKDEFLAGASHHLNTPLAAVLGFARILADGNRRFTAAARSEMIELLAIEAEEASHVAEDLLIAARSDMNELTLEEEVVDLRAAVEAATGSWAGPQLARLKISGRAGALGDRARITQIVRNLLRNAAEFAETSIEVSITESFNKAVLEVIDDGPGIPAEAAEKMFRPYYARSLDESMPPSLGLGLSVGRKLARAMGGNLSHSREHEATVFRLTLPAASDRTESPEMPDLVIDPRAGLPTAEDIERLIKEGGPQVAYQPIVDLGRRDLGEDAVVGYEALARFPSGSPNDWFRAAANCGMTTVLDLSCIRAGVTQFESQRDHHFLSVNVHDQTLTSSRLPDALSGLNPGRLVLELSETATIQNYEKTRGSIERLQDSGIRLAIDDVGAGEIDLWHIVRLRGSVVKVDISLVSEAESSSDARGFIKALLALGEELGVMVIAEGIETEQQHRALQALGVRFGQGYLYGRPQPLKWAARAISD